MVPSHHIVSPLEFPNFALLGIVCAITAIVFMRSVGIVQSLAQRMPVTPWVRPAVAGLLIMVLALADRVYAMERGAIFHECDSEALLSNLEYRRRILWL